ncbi:hypothetical protein IW262DRAFT_519656 [Armillaria fumosa]|nr:hypothetical protein IW262DRAFT_519656 [Armillaria fumosa]
MYAGCRAVEPLRPSLLLCLIHCRSDETTVMCTILCVCGSEHQCKEKATLQACADYRTSNVVNITLHSAGGGYIFPAHSLSIPR